MTASSDGVASVPEWRSDIDSLGFRPAGHSGTCVVHRRAFRTLLGRVASDQDCLAYFRAEAEAFAAAATAKITRRGLSSTDNFHLTSRDLRRAGSDGRP